MITAATKEVTFDAAHRLSFHKGKCYNLHGHTYKLRLTLACEDLENDMVLDFYEIKKILNEVVERYDHTTMLYEGDEKNCKLFDTMSKLGLRVLLFPYEPTVENMAKNFMTFFKQKGLPVIKVTMFETPTSYAEVIDNGSTNS